MLIFMLNINHQYQLRSRGFMENFKYLFINAMILPLFILQLKPVKRRLGFMITIVNINKIMIENWAISVIIFDGRTLYKNQLETLREL